MKGEFHNPKKFETCLKHFLLVHYFYPIKEYFNIKLALAKEYVSIKFPIYLQSVRTHLANGGKG
jgi:hypothetical protein